MIKKKKKFIGKNILCLHGQRDMMNYEKDGQKKKNNLIQKLLMKKYIKKMVCFPAHVMYTGDYIEKYDEK